MSSVWSVDDVSDEALIKEAQNGNKKAMEDVILRYRSLVGSVASGYYGVGFDADDIIQEGMIGLYNAVLDYKSDKASFLAFARVCISRRIVSLLKASSRKKNQPLNTSISLSHIENVELLSELSKNTHNPETKIIDDEALKLQKEKIKKLLSDFEMQVFELYTKDIPYKEIAKILGKGEKTIDNAVQRIRKKLILLFAKTN